MAKPGMVFDLFDASPAQPLHGLPLQQFVDKVCGFDAPSVRNVPLRNDDLLLLDPLLDLLPRLAEIGPLAHHYLVDDDSERVVVHLKSVILVEHDFGSHVAGRSAGVFAVVGPEVLGDSQISEKGISLVIAAVPCLSKTIFSGLTSRWMIILECR